MGLTRSMQWLKPAVIGALGFALAWGCWHLYEDHVQFHALLGYVAAQIQVQQAQQQHVMPGPPQQPAPEPGKK